MPRLLHFALRSILILVLLSILWLGIMNHYNRILVQISSPGLPSNITVRILGSHFSFIANELPDDPPPVPVNINSLTLHYGGILLCVLVLAAVEMKIITRLMWLATLLACSFVAQVVGIVLFAHGLSWAFRAGADQEIARLVFSFFAVGWGLMPATIGGAWCYFYWKPRALVE